MEPYVLGIIIASMFIFLVCLGLIIYAVERKKSGMTLREEIRAYEDEILNKEPLRLTVRAEVIDMTCGVNSVGHNQPKAIKHFIITFKDDDDKILKINVPEEYYEAFEIGLYGTLTLVDNEFYSFEP